MTRPILTPLDAEQQELAEKHWLDAQKLLRSQIKRMNLDPSLLQRLEVDHVAWDGLYRAVRQNEKSKDRARGKFTTFLFHCLRLALIDEFRRMSFRTPHRGESVYSIEDVVVAVEDETELIVEIHDTAEQLFKDLPEPHREIMHRHYLHCDGNTIEDLCEVIGITKKLAWNQIHQSKVMLRKQHQARRTGT